MIDPGTATLIGTGVNLIGGLFSQSSARSAYGHRYQDTVKDMRKAGLNPALAYGQNPGGGAQTADFGQLGSQAADIYRGSSSATQAKQQSEYVQAQTDLLKAQAEDIKNTTHYRMEAASFQPEIAQNARNASIDKARMTEIERQIREYTQTSDMEARTAENQRSKIAEILERAQIPEAQAWADFYRSWVGKNKGNIDLFLQMVASGIGAYRAAQGNSAKSYNTYNQIHLPRGSR